jgi:hypothetical protein
MKKNEQCRGLSGGQVQAFLVLDAILLEANKVLTYITGMSIFTLELSIYERKKHGP